MHLDDPPFQTPILWLSSSWARRTLVDILTKNQLRSYYGCNVTLLNFPRNLTYQPLNYSYLYTYSLFQIHSAYLAQWEIAAGKTFTKHTRSKKCETFISVIRHDLKRVCLPAAIAAWLTTDGWRWHTDGAAPSTPEDLYYGLVLEYPNAVLRYAQYFLFPDQRSELLKLLKPALIQNSYKEAERNAKALFNGSSTNRAFSDLESYD